MQNQLVLAPAMSLQDLEHGGFEVVVDRQARHATPELERMALTQQKGYSESSNCVERREDK